jgi:hypothetical protein
MIQYSKEHNDWLKKKAKELALSISNNKKNMTSSQKRLQGFVPNRTPRTATENYQITKSQKDTFRDKVYILFNNDQKRTNIFVGMYEEFYKNDDEKYVYFNITYPDLVKAFKGVVTRPDTVLKTHEKLLNKFQNDDDDYDDQQTIFNSVNTSHTAHDFIRAYKTQESLYNNVPSSTMSLNQPAVDNVPSRKKGVTWPGYSQSNNNASESDDVSVFDDDALTTVSNNVETDEEKISNNKLQQIEEIDNNLNEEIADGVLNDFLGDIIAEILQPLAYDPDTKTAYDTNMVYLVDDEGNYIIDDEGQYIINEDATYLKDSDGNFIEDEYGDRILHENIEISDKQYNNETEDDIQEFVTYVGEFFKQLNKEDDYYRNLSEKEQDEFMFFLKANNIVKMKILRNNITQDTQTTEFLYTSKSNRTNMIKNEIKTAKGRIYNIYEMIEETRNRMKQKDFNLKHGNLKKSLTAKNKKLNTLLLNYDEIQDTLQKLQLALPTKKIKNKPKHEQKITNTLKESKSVLSNIKLLRQEIEQLQKEIEQHMSSHNQNKIEDQPAEEQTTEELTQNPSLDEYD